LVFGRRTSKRDFQNTCVWIVTDHNQTPSIDIHKRPLPCFTSSITCQACIQQSIIKSTKLFNYSSMMSKTAVQKRLIPVPVCGGSTSFGASPQGQPQVQLRPCVSLLNEEPSVIISLLSVCHLSVQGSALVNCLR